MVFPSLSVSSPWSLSITNFPSPSLSLPPFLISLPHTSSLSPSYPLLPYLTFPPCWTQLLLTPLMFLTRQMKTKQKVKQRKTQRGRLVTKNEEDNRRKEDRENKDNRRRSKESEKAGVWEKRQAVDNIREKVWASFRLLHRSLTPGALSFCFPTCYHSNRWQFHIGATCPADRQIATTRGTRLHTHRHTQTGACTKASLPCWPAVRYRENLEATAYTHQNFITMFLSSNFNMVLMHFVFYSMKTHHIPVFFAHGTITRLKAIQTGNRLPDDAADATE